MSLPLDPYLAGMVAATELLGPPRPWRLVDYRMAAGGAAIIAALLRRAAPAYAADPALARRVRYLAIFEGVVKPPKRETLGERVQAESERWGFANGKAVGL